MPSPNSLTSRITTQSGWHGEGSLATSRYDHPLIANETQSFEYGFSTAAGGGEVQNAAKKVSHFARRKKTLPHSPQALLATTTRHDQAGKPFKVKNLMNPSAEMETFVVIALPLVKRMWELLLEKFPATAAAMLNAVPVEYRIVPGCAFTKFTVGGPPPSLPHGRRRVVCLPLPLPADVYTHHPTVRNEQPNSSPS